MPDRRRVLRVLFIGNDWAEAHHDIELVDESGRRLARLRFGRGQSALGPRPGRVQPAAWAATLA